MKRAFDIALATLGAMTGAALVAVVLPSAAQPAAAPASAASAPAITHGSPCGAPGVGLQLPDRTLLIRKVGVPGLHVDPDGTWTTCRMPEPPKDCIAGNGGRYSWTVGEHSCTATGAPGYLQHGGQLSLRHQHGPLRGAVGLRCTDGKLSHVWENCVPAIECDSSVSLTQDGGKTVHTYDARPLEKRVPLGGYALAVAADGSSVRIQCVDGSFVRAPEAAVVTPAPVQPKAVKCGSQEATGWVGHRYTRVRYGGLSVPVGTVLNVQGAQLICGEDGKLRQDPSVVPAQDPSNPWGRK